MVLESENTEHLGSSKMKQLRFLEHFLPLDLCIGFYLVLTPGCDFSFFLFSNFFLSETPFSYRNRTCSHHYFYPSNIFLRRTSICRVCAA